MPTPDDLKKKQAAAALAGGVAPNTFNGRPVDLTAGARMPTVPAGTVPAGIAGPTGAPAAPVHDPFAVAQQAGTMADNAGLAAQGRVNNTTGPGSADGETMRRLEIAQMTNKGSPSARAAISTALLGQLGASRELATAGVAPIAKAAAGAQDAVNAQDAGSQDAAQKMALQQLVGEQSTGLEQLRQVGDSARNDASIAGNIDVAKIGKQAGQQYTRGSNGALNLVDGASAQTVTGPDGKPLATADPGAVSAKDLFEAYQKRATEIQTSATILPEQKAGALAALQTDPQFAGLFKPQAQAAAKPAPKNSADFITQMRAAGSKMSDAELAAYYNHTYANQQAATP